ncbi:Cytosolic phospholipase A2 zeta [Phytophthora boehmeriae]|uniref:Cytosolic phospholipase A2 zeta n=1 Tax=Phytophthora boehmeriae TaxID=109152 RepID=A0A8T1WVD2_9STRA|nr:Cytosolic phospholipase A2 zeta [Phytophthora boehmeriae]
MERLNAAQVKVKRLNRLEAAIVDFFMEVMDRSENNAGADNGVDVESAFARSKRKEQFLKKAEGDPISLLNSLRTHLRLKFAEQEAQQVAAERKAFADTISNQQKEENNRNEFQQMEQTCNLLKLQQETLIQQVTQHKLEQTRSHRQYRALLDKLNAQVQAHQSREQVAQELATKLRDEVAALKDTRDTLLKASQNQKPHDSNRVIGTTAAGANSVITPSVTNTDFFGTPAENQTLRRALQKYEAKMARMEATNDERKREIQRLQQQLTGLRQNTQLQKYERLEKDSRHLQELADDLKSRLDESDADLLRTKGSLKEREIQVQKMKDDK